MVLMREVLFFVTGLVLMFVVQPLLVMAMGFIMGSFISLILPQLTTSFLTALGINALTFAQLSAIVAFFFGFAPRTIINNKEPNE